MNILIRQNLFFSVTIINTQHDSRIYNKNTICFKLKYHCKDIKTSRSLTRHAIVTYLPQLGLTPNTALQADYTLQAFFIYYKLFISKLAHYCSSMHILDTLQTQGRINYLLSHITFTLSCLCERRPVPSSGAIKRL